MGGKSSPKDTEKSLCPFPQTVQYKCHLSPCPVSLALLSLALLSSSALYSCSFLDELFHRSAKSLGEASTASSNQRLLHKCS